MKHGAQQETPN